MKLPEVISMGNLWVEVMRLHLAEILPHSDTCIGPFPGSDTAIYTQCIYPWRHAAAGPLNPTYMQIEYFAMADESGCRLKFNF